MILDLIYSFGLIAFGFIMGAAFGFDNNDNE